MAHGPSLLALLRRAVLALLVGLAVLPASSALAATNDLRVEMVTPPPRGMAPGGQAYFWFKVTNPGTADVQFSVSSSSSDTGFTLFSSLAGGTAYSGGAFSSTAQVRVSAPADQECRAATVGITVTITGATDENPADNTVTAPVSINCPDLLAHAVADKLFVAPGDNVTFTGTADNIGAAATSTGGATPGTSVGTRLRLSRNDSGVTGGSTWHPLNGSVQPGETGALGASYGTDSVWDPRTATCSTVYTGRVEVFAYNEPAELTDNNTDTATSEVSCVDLTVTKTAPATVPFGEFVEFTITARNTDSEAATGVTVSDPVPAGLTAAGLRLSGSATCSAAGCSPMGGLPADGEFTMWLRGTASTCDDLTNTATVSATNEPASRAAGTANQATAAVNVLCSHLTLQKWTPTPEIYSGQEAEFILALGNDGEIPATNVTLTDELPAGIEWAVDDPACSITDGTLTCTYAEIGLDPADARTITVHGTARDVCGTLSNTATATAPETQDSEATTPWPSAIEVKCLALTKTADAAQADPGQPIGFTMTVANQGPWALGGTTITDTLPVAPGLSWSIDAAHSDEGCTIDLGVLSCDFGLLESDQTRTVHVTSPTTTASCGVISNTAEAGAYLLREQGGPVGTAELPPPSPVTATATVTVPCWDLKLTKSASPATVEQNGSVTYTLGVTNTGTDPLPTSLIRLSDPQLAGLKPTAALPETLAPGQAITYTGTRTLTECGTATNTATVALTRGETTIPEPDPTDNTASASVTVTCPAPPPAPVPAPVAAEVTPPAAVQTGRPTRARLVLVKRGPARATAGQVVRYTIRVTNTSRTPAADVVVSDVVPAGMSLARTPQGARLRAGTATWQVGTLRPGASRTVRLDLRLDSDSSGRHCNTATARAVNAVRARDTACTQVAAVERAVQPEVTG